MKPDAPREIRGDFRPSATCMPGIHVCEHLPRLAGLMDKLALVRSMTHRMNVHGPACSEVFSGREYFGPPVTDQASREDWPSLSSMVMRFGAAGEGLPPSVVLPWYLQFPGQPKRIAGQSGGRMGEQHVVDCPVTPADLAATILLHLGIDPATSYHDDFQRLRQHLSEGRPIRNLG
jgi:hypothetical protein